MDTVERLRAYLGERIPDDGSDDDTLFSNDEINDLLINFQQPLSGQNGLYLAAAEGWDRKAAEYADQADHEQGGAKDSLSSLRMAAVEQADHYRKLAFGRLYPRVAKIIRPGTTAR